MHEIISRKDALARGLKTYFTGDPCSFGMVALRRVSNKKCMCDQHAHSDRRSKRQYLDENGGAQKAREYAKEYRADNLERYRQYDKDRYAANPEFFRKKAADLRRADPVKAADISRRSYYKDQEKSIERAREWRAGNREKVLAALKRYRYANLEKVKAIQSSWRIKNAEKVLDARRKWSIQNAERIKEYSRGRKKKFRHIYNAIQNERRARGLKATPSWYGELDEFVMREAAELCAMRRSATGIEWHVDHMIPLQAKLACGLHVHGNIQVIPALLNLRKNNKMVLTENLEWLAKL